MPRRGRSMPSRPSYSHTPSRPMSTAPAHPPRAAPMQPQAAPRQPGLMGQMAATAGGVALGSVVGQGIGNAMFGGGGGSSQAEAAPQGVQQVSAQPCQQQVYNPCQYELQQFLDCAQGQNDLGLCAGFNEALRQCKLKYGMQP